MTSGRPATGGRPIARLALPALGVLAAEPLYLLFDTAIVGRLGALSLAGLAIGGLILSFVGSQLTFLSYGTTARSARFFGAALGASRIAHARSLARRVTVFSTVAAGALAAVFAVGASVLPELFTDDRSVLAVIGTPWWFLVAQLPVAGVVFALDGVLLGAWDAAFMRTATVVSALVGFLPLVWLSLPFHWGLAGIWSGLSTFLVLRLIFVGARAISGRWLIVGAG